MGPPSASRPTSCWSANRQPRSSSSTCPDPTAPRSSRRPQRLSLDSARAVHVRNLGEGERFPRNLERERELIGTPRRAPHAELELARLHDALSEGVDEGEPFVGDLEPHSLPPSCAHEDPREGGEHLLRPG